MTTSVLGRRLRALLDEREMSQADLARALHCGKSTVSQYISGARTPDVETLRRMAELFGVSLDYLLGRTELRWPSLIKEPEVEVLVARAQDLTPEERRHVLDYIEYLRFRREREAR
ncbi:MAG: helix-turn-helix domain-containing protein [Firmicutes bacterium]|nr:helix-turn-helix domain-containing protein [Bacillota bacterium]